MPPPQRAEPDLVARLRAAGCVRAEDEAALLLEHVARADLPAALGRRLAGEPLEHVLGRAELAGVVVAVHPGVFVPRRRTELLVDVAARLGAPRAVVVDLCCGTGAVGLAVSGRLRARELHAVDVDARAVACAAQNLAAAGGSVHLGDLDEPLPARLRGAVEVVVANAPYVPTGHLALLPREARDHEPVVALDGGDDGTRVLAAVVLAAARLLAPGGVVAVEAGRAQAGAVAAAARRSGLQPLVVRRRGHEGAVVVGRQASKSSTTREVVGVDWQASTKPASTSEGSSA